MRSIGLAKVERRIVQTGQIVRRALVRTIVQMRRILEGLPDRFAVCYEASCAGGAEEAVQVEIGSGTQIASRGPTWRITMPPL
jgi:hypothetical protein